MELHDSRSSYPKMAPTVTVTSTNGFQTDGRLYLNQIDHYIFTVFFDKFSEIVLEGNAYMGLHCAIVTKLGLHAAIVSCVIG